MNERTNIKPRIISRDYNRKPYMYGKDGDYLEMMKAPTAKAIENEGVMEPHSEFKKPYLYDDYQEMEHFYNPSHFPIPDMGGPLPTGRMQAICDAIRVFPCDFDVFPYSTDDCTQTIKAVWKDFAWPCKYEDRGWIINGAYDRSSLKMEVEDKPGGTALSGGGPELAVLLSSLPDDARDIEHSTVEFKFDESQIDDEGYAVVDLYFEIKGRCKSHAQIKVLCETCPPDVAVSWNTDLSAETIAPGDPTTTVDIFVKDGYGPYSWEVSGTGFTLGAATTSGVANTLIADSTACGPATITVTDKCEGSATGWVRCTTGDWVWYRGVSCEDMITCGTCGGSYTWSDTYYNGKWAIALRCWSSGSCSDRDFVCLGITGSIGLNCPVSYQNCCDWIKMWEWQCPA